MTEKLQSVLKGDLSFFFFFFFSLSNVLYNTPCLLMVVAFVVWCTWLSVVDYSMRVDRLLCTFSPITIVKFTQLCSKFSPAALLNFACDG